MKIKIFITISVLFFSLCSLAQNKLYFDKNWNSVKKEKKAKYYRIIKPDSNNSYIIVEDYYISGEIQMRGQYVSIDPDIKHGETAWYSEDGKITTKAMYKDGIFDGEYSEWHKSGKLKLKCNYQNGKYSGSFKEYFPDEKMLPILKHLGLK